MPLYLQMLRPWINSHHIIHLIHMQCSAQTQQKQEKVEKYVTRHMEKMLRSSSFFFTIQPYVWSLLLFSSNGRRLINWVPDFINCLTIWAIQILPIVDGATTPFLHPGEHQTQIPTLKTINYKLLCFELCSLIFFNS